MYRPEHPNPMKKHSAFVNLNGSWEFEFDNTLVGKEKKYYERDLLDMRIEVPFCPESRLSGIGNTDFINAVWYRRDIELTQKQLEGTVLITFGAVDYESEIYINGKFVMSHIGGYTPFTADATSFLHAGKNSLCVYAKDNARHGIPHGKQSELLKSHHCDYTRTTGIWQTVYMDILPSAYIKDIRVIPDVEGGSVSIHTETVGAGRLVADILYKSKVVGHAEADAVGSPVIMQIPLSEIHLWEVGAGRLYDIRLTLGDDIFESYFGLRSVRLDEKKFLINNKSVFQRLVLDQGYYEDGIYTAPAAADIEKDIELSLSLGFNGARPHMKVFEPLYLYYCDIHGYIAWGEFPCWGLDFRKPETLGITLPQWTDAMARDYNHPSIVGWCPLNETHIDRYGDGKKIHDDIVRNLYLVTKALDITRPCIDTSGYVHQKFTDIYDVHDYSQDPKHFRDDFTKIVTGEYADERNMYFRRENLYAGQPLFVSEFGGARWSDSSENSWGYGDAPKTVEEFIERLDGLCTALLDDPDLFGFCYTQLYDIEQECNGLLYYNRSPKFDNARIKSIIGAPARIEK